MFAGGYTSESDGHAVGVTSLLNERSAKKVRLEPVSTMPLASPTWLTRHPRLPVLLATSEADPGSVSSLRYEPDGSLVLLSTVEIVGDSACHVAITPDGEYAIAAAYGSGALSVLAVHADGTLSAVLDSLQFEGSGPVADRQQTPHAHQVVAVGDQLLACDLGGDQIHRLRLDGTVLLPVGDPLRLPAGSGPRHLVAPQGHLVVAGELNGTLWLAAPDGDSWREAQVVPSSGRDGHVQPSGIATDGTRVYVANRGVDTVAVFDLDPVASTLTPVAEFDSGGAWPRDLTLDGGLLWVSNQRSDTVAVFEVSPLPAPGPVVELSLPSPTVVVLVHEEPEPDAAQSDDAQSDDAGAEDREDPVSTPTAEAGA